MIIRPTSIIAYSNTETDLREFSHTLNQQQITDTDCIIPIWHKNQLSQINRKDLSEGMSPWSAYHRDWLTSFTLDLDYLRQGVTWYRDVDDDGVLYSYRFKGAQDQITHYNDLLSHFETGLVCESVGRYISIVGMTASPRPWIACNKDENMEISDDTWVQVAANTREGATHIVQSLSRFLWLLIVYGNIQHTNSVCTALKINLPITGYTRSQLSIIEADIAWLRQDGLFIQQYIIGSGMKQNLELVTNDPELIQLLLPYLQYIDSEVTMTTFDTLRTRSEQVIQLWLGDVPMIAKPRTLS